MTNTITIDGTTLPAWQCPECGSKIYPASEAAELGHMAWHRHKEREMAHHVAWLKQQPEFRDVGASLVKDYISCQNCGKIGKRARAHTCTDCTARKQCTGCGAVKKLVAKGKCANCYMRSRRKLMLVSVRAA